MKKINDSKTICLVNMNKLDMHKDMNELKKKIEKKYNVKITESKPDTVNE